MNTLTAKKTGDQGKLKDLIHYVAFKCDPDKLGAVKLNKVLWYSDMLAFLATGRAITNAHYIKQPLGPVASELMPVVAELEEEGKVLRRQMMSYGTPKVDYLAFKEPDLSAFSAFEIDVVQDVIQFVCHEHSARSISELSHGLIWQMAEIGEPITYKTALATRLHPVMPSDLAWAKAELAAVPA